VIKNRPPDLRETFNRLDDHLCISSVNLAEFLFGTEKLVQRDHDLAAVEGFVLVTKNTREFMGG